MSNADETIHIVEAEMARTMAKVKRIEKKEMTEAEKIRVGEVYQFHKHVKRLIEVYNRDRAIAFGRIPPHSIELEKLILGTLILECRPSRYPKLDESIARVKKLLQPDHFYSEVHQIIYKAVISLEQPDGRSVYEKLRKEGLSEVIGGLAYIASLTGLVVNSYQEENAMVLVEFALKRKLIMIGATFMDRGYDNTSDALEALESAIKELDDTHKWIK